MSRVRSVNEQVQGHEWKKKGDVSVVVEPVPGPSSAITIRLKDKLSLNPNFPTSRCHLLSIPLVVQDCIFESLSPRDFLTLRRVCKTTNDWMVKKPWTAQIVRKWQAYTPVLNSENPYGMKYAVAMKAPLTSFQIMINQKEPKDLVYKFLSIYGPSLKSLHFTRSVDSEEIELSVCGKGNSCACTRKRLCFKCKDRVSVLDVLLADEIRFPFVFQKLNELKLDFVIKNRVEAQVVLKVLEKCTALSFLHLPLFDIEEESPDFTELPVVVIEEFLNPVIAYIQRRGRHNVKVVDMDAWRDSDILDHGMISNRLVDLLTEGAVFNVKFINFLADIIERNLFSRVDWQSLLDQNHDSLRPYQTIQSLVNPGPKLLSFANFPNLEGLIIGCSDYQSYTIPQDIANRVKWPKLSWLSIDTTHLNGEIPHRFAENVVLNVPGEARKNAWTRMMNMVGGFNGAVNRRSVKKLTVNEKSARVYDGTFHACGLEFPPTMVASAFTELTSLEINRWDSADDEGFILLWKTLRKLQKIKIKNCYRLTDYGFIGRKESSPVFHKLKALEKLEIILSSTASHLTDRTLIHVFSHMPLYDFRLEGCLHEYGKTTGQITEDGILALADGVFGKTIQVFHLDVDASPWLTPRRCGELSRVFRRTV